MTSALLDSAYVCGHGGLAALGFSTIPVKASEKRPAINGWQRYCDRMPTQAEHEKWSRIPGAGLGICLGIRVGDDHILVAVDLDVEGDDLDKLCAALPASPMEKRGRKGVTRYYLADASIRAARYKASDGRGLADLQAHGTQTVVPPSMHPDTGQPYVFTAGPVMAAALPVLTFDDLDRFEDALEGLGWQPGVTTLTGSIDAGQAAPSGLGDDEGGAAAEYFREINKRALADPGCYVPFLGLHNLRPKAGGYSAVADWRPSRDGNRIEERKRNLSIHATGIVDFGTGQGYSPIDLVMAATGGDLETAADFLFERTGLKAEHDAWFQTSEPAFERLRARCSEEDRRLAQEEARTLLRRPSSLLIERHGEPSPFAPVRWLIKNRLYEKGVALFAGPSGGAKTFSAIHAAVGFATGAPVFGAPVRKRAGTLFVLGEGRASMRRRLQAASLAVGPIGGVDLGALPISFVEATIEDALKRDVLIAAAKEESDRMRERHGIDLGIVVVDTLAACCLFKDENDAADAQRVMDGLLAISRELDCLVIATAHYGKSAEPAFVALPRSRQAPTRSGHWRSRRRGIPSGIGRWWWRKCAMQNPARPFRSNCNR